MIHGNTSASRRTSAINLRAFPAQRELIDRACAETHKNLTEKLQQLESRYDKQFKDVYDAINFLLQKDHQETTQKQRKRIGF